MKKMRVYWIPQVGVNAIFYIPVSSVEEAKKYIDILSAYDCFQYNKNIKPDYCNLGGLEMYNDETEEWENWYYEDEETYIEDIDEYCNVKSPNVGELKIFEKEVLKQVNFNS